MKVRAVKGAAMPSPRNRKTLKAASGGWVRAKPSAGAMKGAVQGAATTTARAPVKAAPARPSLEARPAPTPWTEVPISNTPERLRPTTKNR